MREIAGRFGSGKRRSLRRGLGAARAAKLLEAKRSSAERLLGYAGQLQRLLAENGTAPGQALPAFMIHSVTGPTPPQTTHETPQ